MHLMQVNKALDSIGRIDRISPRMVVPTIMSVHLSMDAAGLLQYISFVRWAVQTCSEESKPVKFVIRFEDLCKCMRHQWKYHTRWSNKPKYRLLISCWSGSMRRGYRQR